MKAYTLLLLLALVPLYSPPGTAASWNLADLTPVDGTAQQVPEGLRLTPDATGKIYLTLDTAGIDLDGQSLVHIRAESEFPLQLFLLWKSALYGDQLFQFRIEAAPTPGEPVVVDMAGRDRWEGEATMIGLGVFAPGRREVLLREFSLHRPGLMYDARAYARTYLSQWTSFIPWQASDSNFYTGTTGYREGTPPVPVFTGLLAVCALGCVLVLVARGRPATFNWRVVGGLVLFAWIALDLLWLQRLGARAMDTLDNRAGKTPREILLATKDAPVYTLVSEAMPLIQGTDPRVFVASDSDYHGMLGSYYLTPLNTYWARSGPELPKVRYIKTGDYLLLVRPTLVPFDAERNVVIFPGDEEVAVEPLYISPLGGLLRVL